MTLPLDGSFTGSRNGPTPESEAAFRRLVAAGRPTVFRHGACLGWDAAAVRIVRDVLGTACRIIAYPGRGKGDTGDERPDRDRESLELSDEVRPEAPHLTRNRLMVAEGGVVVACPPTAEPQARVGTWYTIRQAEAAGKLGAIVGPAWRDGGEGGGEVAV